jgi:hypothetical protein
LAGWNEAADKGVWMSVWWTTLTRFIDNALGGWMSLSHRPTWRGGPRDARSASGWACISISFLGTVDPAHD